MSRSVVCLEASLRHTLLPLERSPHLGQEQVLLRYGIVVRARGATDDPGKVRPRARRRIRREGLALPPARVVHAGVDGVVEGAEVALEGEGHGSGGRVGCCAGGVCGGGTVYMSVLGLLR